MESSWVNDFDGATRDFIGGLLREMVGVGLIGWEVAGRTRNIFADFVQIDWGWSPIKDI